MIVLIPKFFKLGEGFSKIEKLKAQEHPGRQTNPYRGYQSASTWICHLLDLRKPILLCSFCRHKFDPKKQRYRPFWCPDAMGQNPMRADGQCEDCKEDTRRVPGGGVLFVAEETFSLICKEPREGRRSVRARASFAGKTIWGTIQEALRS